MKKIHIYYCLLLAILVTGLYNIFMPSSAFYAEQHLKVGQIVEKDIIAPFDFPILKTKQQLDQEKAVIARRLKPVYNLDDEIQFKAIKTLDLLFLPLIEDESESDTTRIINRFKSEGIGISGKSALILQNNNLSRNLYNYLLSELDRIYRKGVYDFLNSDSVNVVSNGEISKQAVSQLLSVTEAIESIQNNAPNSAQKEVLTDMLPDFIKPNLHKDQDKFNELVEQEAALIPKSVGSITKNEILVRSNARISAEDLNKIQSMIRATEKDSNNVNIWKSFSVNISFFFYFFFLGLMLFIYYKYYYSNLLDKRYHFSPLIAGLGLNAVLAILNNQILGLQTLLIPYSLTVLTAAILIDIPFAMFYNFLSFASIYPFVNWETFSPLALVLATSGVLLLLCRLRDKHQYFSIWLYLLLTTEILTIIFALYNMEPFKVLIVNMGYAFISSTLTVILMLFVVPYLEKKWNLATKQQLLELLDFNHPLLKKLATEAVGTYYHSLIVGNLAERAAEAIGADALLARVGSYYHDIGKVVSPHFFTENNPLSAEIHDNLSPSDSAAGIKNHVQEGITLAHKYNIPTPVLDIILQHHGTSYIRYFLDKAEKSRITIDLDKYRYDGPKPKTKEAALVMIADIVESIAKSWDDINPDDIRKILNDTIFRLIREGQFDDSPLTMNDLSKVKDCMIPILESIYRKRTQYPETETPFE